MGLIAPGPNRILTLCEVEVYPADNVNSGPWVGPSAADIACFLVFYSHLFRHIPDGDCVPTLADRPPAG